MNWLAFTKKVSRIPEKQLERMLDTETRPSFIVRIHQRFTRLRADRERRALLTRLGRD